MRVLWLVKGLGPGGAERLLVSAAAAHDRREFEFRVAYLLPWKDALVAELEALGVPCTCLGVKDERDVRWARRLRRDLRAHPVDIVHAHSPYPAGVGRMVVRTLPRSRRPHLMYTTHNTWSSFSPVTRMLNGLTFRLDDADLAVSQVVQDTIWPRLQRRSEVLEHGVLLDDVRSRWDRVGVRTELGIGRDEIVVGTVANFRAQKDYPNLLAAARLLADRDVPVRIVAVGQGPQEAAMRALHAELGLGDRVLLLGQRDDAIRVMSGCDIFTMASNNEGLPVALMEALALGLPVVATAVGGIPEAVTDGVEGLLVPPHDPGALAAALQDLVEHPERRSELAAGAALGGDRFDIRRTTARIEAIYRQIGAR